MITFDRVDFRYNVSKETSPILGGVSFAWRKAEIVGLVGGNGAGKSTLCLLAAGLLIPSGGSVTVSGIDTRSGDPEIQRVVGIIFQNPDNQIVGTTVAEDLAFGMENLGVAPEDMHERVVAIAERFHLKDRLESPIHELSGGMRQRLALAAVMVMRPDFLILDEPTSHLDPWARYDLWRFLEEVVREDGVGLLIISQRAEDLARTDRLLVLKHGSLVFSGPTAQAWDHPELRDWNVPVLPAIRLQQRLAGACLVP